MKNQSETKSKKKRRILVQLTLTCIFMIAGIAVLKSFSSFSWSDFYSSLTQLNWRWVITAFLVSTVQVVIQMFRLWILFSPVDRPTDWTLHSANLIGQTLNAITPLRSGDAYKILRLTSKGIPLQKIGSALVAERIADSLALLFLTSLFALQYLRKWTSSFSQNLAFTVVLILLSGVFLWITLSKFSFPEKIQRLLNGTANFIRTVKRSVFSRRFLYCFLISTLGWTFDAGTLLCNSRAANVPLSVGPAIISVFAVNLGIALPITVANVGVFEGALALALKAGVPGLSLEKALSIATFEHLAKIVGLVSCLFLGTTYLVFKKLFQRLNA